MIDYISGILSQIEDDHIVIEANGIGYQIFIPTQLLADIPTIGNKIRIFTHLIHKEDSMELYGFLEVKEREIFRHLITVSGIGNKLAMKILSTFSYIQVIQAVITKDSTTLSKVSGLGKKTSEKIIIELESKFKKRYPLSTQAQEIDVSTNEKTAIEALIALGYKENESRSAVLNVVNQENPDNAEDIIKSSLKILAKIT